MAMAPLGPTFHAPPVGPATGAGAPTAPVGRGAEGEGFGDLITGFLRDANAQQLQADEATRQLVTGEADSVHDVVLSLAKADLTFRMVLEIRNKLLEAYQEIMRMQM